MGESFRDAKPANAMHRPRGELSDDLTLGEIQELLFDVQSRQEEKVIEHGQILEDFLEAEDEWKAHEARVLILIRDRLAAQKPDDKNKEKSSADLREAEILTSLNEEGITGRTLRRKWRLMEERLKQADRYCKTLESRGRFLQSLAANIRDIA